MSSDELTAGAKRLQGSGYGVAVWPDGKARIHDVNKPWPEGAVVYDGAEMMAYVDAPPLVRATMREVKKLRAGAI